MTLNRVSYGENQEAASRASGAAQIAQAMDVAQSKNLPTFVGCIMVVLHCSIVIYTIHIHGTIV